MERLTYDEVRYLYKSMIATNFNFNMFIISYVKKFFNLSKTETRSIIMNGINRRQRMGFGALFSYKLLYKSYYKHNDVIIPWNNEDFKWHIENELNKISSPNTNAPHKVEEREALFNIAQDFNDMTIRYGTHARNPQFPFLTVEVDGVSMVRGGKPDSVVEIKCLKIYKSSFQKFFEYSKNRKNSGVLLIEDGTLKIDENSKNYFQVQMQLAVLNLNFGYLVFYSNQTCYMTFEILRNDNYINVNLCKIHDLYVKHGVPFLRNKYKL